MVPENDLALVATLPITLPVGVLVLVIDHFIVWPVDIVGDVGEATDDIFWNDSWLGERYLEFVATTPFRVLGTLIFVPLAFVVVLFFDLGELD